ncbi:MAG: hypothetical protein RL347_1074 [Actinomycetota bacterium]|jgi:hypothetical protein
MTSAEPRLEGSAALASLARVLGVDPGVVRADTPLASLGWDSLARVCWEEAMADVGYTGTLASAPPVATVGDLVAASSRTDSGGVAIPPVAPTALT